MNATINAIAKAFETAAARTEFERPAKSSIRAWAYVIEPALGAGARRVVIDAETQAEADLKAKQAAKEMFEAECLIKLQE